MATNPAVLRTLRKLHLYFGLFIAPALLFFAFTGALQTFSLHESSPGSSYKPPAWLMSMAQMHKNQTLQMAPPKAAPKPPADPSKPAHQFASTEAQRPPASPSGQAFVPKWKRHIPMKIFFELVVLGLFISTLTGIYMAYKYERNPSLVTSLLVAGVVVPLLLTLF